LTNLGALIDLSHDLKKPDGLRLATKLAGTASERNLNSEQRSLCHYFYANAWAGLRDLAPSLALSTDADKRKANLDYAWKWEQSETEKEIFHLRSALNEEAFRSLPTTRRCQVFTNLGNLYDTVGRAVEALELWGQAIAADPSFGMAYGNRRIGLADYGESLYDNGHRYIFFRFALLDLERALTTELHPDARRDFNKKKEKITVVLTPEHQLSSMDLDGFPLGDSEQEIQYYDGPRKSVLPQVWC
jgi:tetratricopeptide (TPR) repeat protein